MPTLDLSPGVDGDDGVRTSTEGFSNTILHVGGVSGSARFAFFRFPSATVPVGATITVAYIVLTRNNTTLIGESVLTNIFGIAEDNHVAPANATEWGTDHGLHTSASAVWDFTSGVSGTHQTPSLVAVLQEIIDRPGWASGNAIGLHIDDDGSLDGDNQFWDDFGDANPPVLHIEYSTSDPANLVATVDGSDVTLTWDV